MLCGVKYFSTKYKPIRKLQVFARHRQHWNTSTRISNEIIYFLGISSGKYYRVNICISIIINFRNLNYELCLLNPQQFPIHILYTFLPLFSANENYVVQLLYSYGMSRVFLILHDWHMLLLPRKIKMELLEYIIVIYICVCIYIYICEILIFRVILIHFSLLEFFIEYLIF